MKNLTLSDAPGLLLPHPTPSRQLTNVELQAFRKLLHMDVKLAAELAGCTVQSWYAWENGTNPVPNKIAEFMDSIHRAFKDCLASYTNMVREQADGERVAMRYYETFELFTSHHPQFSSRLDWRISQAVAARLMVHQQVYLISAEKIEKDFIWKIVL
ncbi:hypothetical protein CBW54_09515 [Yersinia kristensenii]|nr:hypothetical protein CBW54_09515 [Yersinia kristensenii]